MSARKNPDLKAPLGELLDDEGLDAESLERVRLRMRATRRVEPNHRRPLALAAAAVLAVGVVAYLAWPERSGPLERAAGGPLVSIEGETRLSDGSTITPEGEVAIEVVENTGERVVLVQGDGRVAYQVTPGGPRRWSIDAGAVTVDVVGTRFVVDRDENAVRLSVQRGRVRVRGEAVPGGVRSLGPGEALEVSVTPAPVRVDARPDEPAEEPPEGGSEPGPEAPTETVAPEQAPAADRATQARRWRALARRSDYAGAFRLLGPEGFRRATAEARAVETLLLLADVARAGGHPELAVDPLRAIVDEHAEHPRAAWAALTLGRLQLDRLNRPAEAASSLSRALDLGLAPRLRETALARLIDAHRRAGQPGRAILLRAQYESEFPNGRYIAPAEDEPR